IKKYVYTLLEYLENEFDDKEIFIQRLSGKAFQQLADEFGYSRQGAKNVVSRVVRKLPTFEEEYRYNKLFKEYYIEETLFCKLFNESTKVYQFLIHKIGGKNRSILEDFHILDLDDNQKECLLKHFNCFISLGGEVVEYTRSNVFNEVLKKYSNEKMSYGDIQEKYNDFITKHKLPEHLYIDLNSIRGILDRSNYIIRCKSHLFRYYDYKVLNRQMLTRLHELLMLEQGIYSTRKLFNENPELMEELDIWTEYELHNLLKRYIRPPRVKYTRMPEFTIGKITKKDFLIECFIEVAPLEFKEFLRYADLKYGLRQDSLASYITSELYQYIHNDYIKVDFKILSHDKINELKKCLSEPIYTLEQFKSIGSRIEKDFSKYVNNMNLSNIGYSLKNNYVLSNEYSSVDDYFTSIILSQDYFIYEDLPIYKSQTYANVIGKLEKNFEIIKVEKDIYITSKKLEKANISYDVIMDYRMKLLDLVPHDEFFTLKSIRDLGFEHIIDEFGFEDIFYERMISRFDGIATIRLGVGYIFKLSDMQISLTDFIYHCISIRRKVNLYDLHEELKNSLGLEIDTYKIISIIQHIDIFYSEELQRFYIDKDEYYEEVFS
ncbi:hypothetical protein, partial [Gottfriedia acidiceleris]|uniref:hypothetical protein n=1 Tax=Gottfriedia acidiceleris TaxID=371036 RepID=UPI003000BE1A